MRIRLTSASLTYFQDNRIFFDNRDRPGRLRIDDVVEFTESATVEPYIGVYTGETLCAMGHGSYSNARLATDLSVGRYCCLSWNLTFGGFRHPIEFVTMSNFSYDRDDKCVSSFLDDNAVPSFSPHHFSQKSPIVIGHDVWIGMNTIIMTGATIGTGAVIAAGSVVTKSVPPYEVWGGNPARHIRKRFDQAIINLLLQSEWWRYSFAQLSRFPISEPAKFCDQFLKVKDSIEAYCPLRTKLSAMPGDLTNPD